MANESIENLLQQSQFVISGTVEELGAATMPSVPVSPNTAVVRIDEVLHAPPVLTSRHAGTRITVYLNQPESIKVGAHAIFFAKSWMYGQSLAVVEVARMEDGKADDARKQIAAAESNIADRKLADRMAKAELVLLGRITGTHPLDNEKLRMPGSEHTPHWWQATIQAEAVLKGKLPENPVSIVFPNSLDEMWIDSPKFKPRQEAIVILQRNQQEKGWPIMRILGLTALDPLDVQPPEQRDRIQKLLP
jgi:hypothetical protein